MSLAERPEALGHDQIVEFSPDASGNRTLTKVNRTFEIPCDAWKPDFSQFYDPA